MIVDETKIQVQVTFPVLEPRWVPIEKMVANDYNPNAMPPDAFKLLILSIKEDGLTRPVVTYHDREADLYVIVDGFHRFKVLRDHFKVSHVPVVVIDRPLRDLMASTFRHNRATGVHNRALVEALVRKLAALGWSDTQISRHLGMKAEEVLRLKQARGIAEYYAHRQYSRAWVWVQVDDEPEADDSQNGAGEPGDELPGLEDGR